MGLDMYLFKRKRFKKGDDEYNELVRDSVEEVCYWRKANQIREWMVKHTDLKPDDNCGWIELTVNTLNELREDCLKVLNNHYLAKEIMPTSAGFFFGSTEYNEWYFSDLQHTVEAIDRIFNTTDFDTEMIEYTEWW